MAIDEDGRSLLINKKQSVLLHRFSFKGPVRAAEFSPDGQFIACAVGKVLQARAHSTSGVFKINLFQEYALSSAAEILLDCNWPAPHHNGLTACMLRL